MVNQDGNGSTTQSLPVCGGCASAKERCGNGLEKIYPTTAVRYGSMRHIGEFSHPPDMKFSCGAKVVVSTDRGIELGEQVSLTCFGCDKSVSRDAMRSYAETSGGDTFRLKNGRILREATESDVHEWEHIVENTSDKLATCRRLSAELGLEMKIVDCEHIFGGERVVFYFMAEERIDFRELVRRLASEFQTRIEMRQIGARDEARLLADVETCGRECCCKNFLKTLKPISMSMAKLQKTTLDIAKVSGRCGRLKCCLRYEHESYQEMNKKLPRVGLRISTAHGTGRVIDRQILTQLVKLHTDEGKVITVVAEDILEWGVPEPPPREERERERRDRRPDRRERRPASKRPAERSGEGTSESSTGDVTSDESADKERTSRRSRRSRSRGKSRRRSQDGAPTEENSGSAEAGNASDSNEKSEGDASGESSGKDGTSRRRRRRRRRPRGGKRDDGSNGGDASGSNGGA